MPSRPSPTCPPPLDCLAGPRQGAGRSLCLPPPQQKLGRPRRTLIFRQMLICVNVRSWGPALARSAGAAMTAPPLGPMHAGGLHQLRLPAHGADLGRVRVIAPCSVRFPRLQRWNSPQPSGFPTAVSCAVPLIQKSPLGSASPQWYHGTCLLRGRLRGALHREYDRKCAEPRLVNSDSSYPWAMKHTIRIRKCLSTRPWQMCLERQGHPDMS
jgi:hypothetical protein